MRRKTISSRLAAGVLAGAAGFWLAACGSPPPDAGSAADAPAAADSGAAEDPGEAAMVGDPEHGEEIFTVCAGCHGPDARGLPGLGKDLHSNEFLAALDDDEAVDFLKEGRAADHELNSTGVAMPPKGGNPAFTDQDLYDIVAYMRTLE